MSSRRRRDARRPPTAWAPTVLGAAVGLAITLFLGSRAGSQSPPDLDPRTAPIPDLSEHKNDPSKTFLVGLTFNGRDQVTATSVEVVPGSTRMRGADPPLLRAETFDLSDRSVELFYAWHPLWSLVYGDDHREHLIVEDSATGHITMPFRSDLKTVKVVDVPLNREVASVSLEQAIRDFCATNRGDPECRSDLTVAKVASEDPAVPGRDLTYTVTVTNKGPKPAYANRVVDQLPDGVVYRSDTGGCTKVDESHLGCDIGVLPVGASTSFTVTVGIDSNMVNQLGGGPASITNEVTVVHSVGSELDISDNTASAVTPLVEVADLAINKSDAEDPVVAGRVAAYKLHVTNEKGPSTASRVRVVDTLPNDVSFVFGSTGCSAAGRVVTCDVGPLRVGEGKEVLIQALVDSNLVLTHAGGGSATITNEATVENVGGEDEDATDNTSQTTTTVIEEADVGVVKTDVADPVAAGTDVEYRVRVSNLGPSTASRVALSDTLPEGVTFAGSTGSCVPVDASPRQVACTVGDLAIGTAVELTITGHVDPDLVRARAGSGSVSVTNQVAVKNAGGPDPNPGNNADEEDTAIIEVADLSVAKSDSPDPVGAGTELVYTLTVTNAGPSTASRVRIVDALHSEVAHRSDTGGCQPDANGSLVCEVGAVAVGEQGEVTITVLVGEDVVCRNGGPVDISNVAIVENPGALDPVADNNQRSEATRVLDNQVGGSAFAEQLRVALAGIAWLSSGPDPTVNAPSGGCGPFDESRALVSVPTAELVDLQALRASVRGDRSGPDAFVNSSAAVTGIAVPLAGIRLENVRSECKSDEEGSKASTSVGRLEIAGKATVEVAPNPGSRIEIPGVGTLILNEQVTTDSPPQEGQPGRSSVVVTAVRLKLRMLGLIDTEIVLAQSTCSIEGLNVLS